MCTICSAYNPYATECVYQEVGAAMQDTGDAPTSATTSYTVYSSDPQGGVAAAAGGSSGSATQTQPSGDVFDPWLSDYHWTAGEITFSFPTNGDFQTYNSPNIAGELNDSQKDAVRTVLDEISSFTGLTFTEIPENNNSHAVLTFTEDTSISGAYAYYPYPHSWSDWGGDAWFGSSSTDPVVGNEDYLFFLHEIGHAMGLLHGHEFQEFVDSGLDSQEYTVVTYTDYVGDTQTNRYDSGDIDWSQSYQQLDIAAMQYLYGANYASSGQKWSGDTVYTFDQATGEMSINGVGQGTPAGNRIFRTIWDGNGSDTYDLSNYTENLKIDLEPGAWSLFSAAQLADLNQYSADPQYLAIGNVANARLYQGDIRSLIENASGGIGHDRISGNQIDNVLSGGGGNDRLDGRAGNDTLVGGDGNDRLFGGAGADILDGGDGRDWLGYSGSATGVNVDLSTGVSSGGYADGDTVLNIEAIVGTVFGDVLTGDGANNFLRGGGGIDTIFGGSGNDFVRGDAGADILDGGLGYDWLDYRNSNNSVTVNLETGKGSGGHAHGDTFTGFERIFGSDFADSLTGDGGANIIRADAGDDYVFGGAGADNIRGGAGADTMHGFVGVDTLDYRDSDAGVNVDLATGAASGGHAQGDVFTGFERIWGSAFDDTLSGSDGRNTLRGYDGDDILFGSAGEDVLNGGNGTDTATFAGAQAGYQIVNNGGTSWSVTQTSSGDIDTLIGIELLSFDDTTVSWTDFVI